MVTGTKQQKAANDLAIIEAYEFPKASCESDTVARLFKMYQKLTK